MKNLSSKLGTLTHLIISEQEQEKIKGGGFATIPLGGSPPEIPILD